MDMTWNSGALVITPHWADTTKDEFNVETTPAHTMDLTGATLSVDVYLPEAYIADEKLAMQIYLKDADGNFSNGGWSEAKWGPWRWSGSETSATLNSSTGNHFGWVTLTFTITPTGINGNAFGYSSPHAVDITKISTFGINFVSHGKPINVTGDIKVDNVVLPGL